MFDMIASKIGEAQAFADGVASLEFVNMDRLLEEQEREEQKAKDDNLRQMSASGDLTDAISSHDSLGRGATAAAGETERDTTRRSGEILGDVEIPRHPTPTAEPEQFQQGSRMSSPIGNASHSSFSDRLAAIEDGSVNFEDEFDPILASIRKPPQQQQQQQQQQQYRHQQDQFQQQQSAKTSTTTILPPSGGQYCLSGGEQKQDLAIPSSENDVGKPSAGSTFAAGFLSVLPGDMRAKAGTMMAQSSARISESANALRSALGTGGVGPSLAEKFKRRQSDQSNRDGSELEEARRGRDGGLRPAGVGGDEDEVRTLNVNDLLSEEEKQQLLSLSGGSGGAGRYCGWRRLRKYAPVALVIGLLGLFYLWRWTSLTVGGNENRVASLGSERS